MRAVWLQIGRGDAAGDVLCEAGEHVGVVDQWAKSGDENIDHRNSN